MRVLASWNDGAAREAIVEFAQSAARDLPPEALVAVFDNDGTLWSEKPCRSSSCSSSSGWRRWPSRTDPCAGSSPGRPPTRSKWARQNAGGNVTTDQFIRLAERISHQQLDDLFQAWLFTPGRPELPGAAAARSSATALSAVGGAFVSSGLWRHHPRS